MRERLPLEDVVYLADQAHVPYGDRDEDDLVRLTAHNVRVLEDEGVDAIVVGCNTTCAVASRRGWPPARVPVLDLIASAAADVAASGARRVGVVGTVATIRSGAYGAAIRALAPQARVQEVAAPRLVPLVEAGLTHGPSAARAVAEALAPFDEPLDALVLACTHYPLLDDAFAEALGADVLRIDPAVTHAARAVAWVDASQRGVRRESGATLFLTTGSLGPFAASLASVVGLGPRDTVATRPVPLRA